jgi:integrase
MKVRLRYLYSIPDRHGNERLYFWRGKGHPRIRIREPVASVAFAERYDALVQGTAIAAAKLQRARPRTWRWLCVQYFASPEFGRLEPTTKSLRRRILESTFGEPVSPGAREIFADFPIDRMRSKAIRVLRDRKAKLPHAANNRLKAIRYVFNWAVEAEHVADNPARDVALLRARSEGHHSWTIAEVEQFEARHSIGTKARLALDLLIYTGSRRSDVVRLGRQHTREGWLSFKQAKTRVPVELPILAALQESIDATPTGELTFLVTERGIGFTAAGFGNWFRERCDEARLHNCSAHGLRKASATRAAENGATANQLMAMFGWLSVKEAERYTRGAQRKKLAHAALTLLQSPKTKQGT